MAEVLDELGYPREVTKEEVVSAFLQTIQRALNCLSAEEQKLRRNAIEKLHVCLLKDDGGGSLPPLDVLQEVWDDVILGKVLGCVSDPTERCRELAIQLIREVAQSLTEVDCTLKKTVPVMEERMGQLPVLEGSEEIRLQLLSLLIDVLLPECELLTLKNLIDPLHRIVAVTLFDQFHEVQKKACSLLVALANRDPEVFGNKTGVFLRGLVPWLNHAHSRVRIAVFQAIDAMMQCGLTKSLVAQQLAPGTKSLAFDHNVAVRELFFTSVGNWLNFKSNMMTDEEIHQCVVSGKIPRFHLPELLPLLLLGITDDYIDIATLTYERLEGIGEIYKKFMDHLDTRATHGPKGERFRSEEEDAKLMEKVMEDERKCQEKYERELREAEEQRRLQRESGARESTSEDITSQEDLAQEPSLYQSLKAQTSSMEEELNQAVLSTEKILGTHSRLFNRPDEEPLDSYKDSDEDQQRLQGVSDSGNSTSADTTTQEGLAQEPSLYQSRKSQTSSMEDELNRAALSAEKILDTDLPLINEPDKEPHDSDKEPLHSEKDQQPSNPSSGVQAEETTENESYVSVSSTLEKSPPKLEQEEHLVLSDAKTENNNSLISTWVPQESEDENLTADERSGASGLHIFTNEGDDDDGRTEPTLTPSLKEKDTSEITDEGAVKKLDTSEAGVETLQLPKPWKGRANAGCRLMVEAFLRPMIEPALKELKQWRARTRLCAARFLHTLMVLAEGFAKDNLDILIPAFFSAVGDEDVKVAKRVAAVIHIIGFHVPPRKWLPSVLKRLGTTKASQAQRENVLAVTAAFLYGTPRKAMEEKHVVKICDKLYENEVFCSNHSAVQNQLLQAVANLIQVAGALCKSSSFKIFVLVLRLQSVEGDAQLQKRSGQALKDLAQALGMESARELYVQHMHGFLDIVTTGCEGWSSSLPGKFVFHNFIRSSIDIVGPHLESLMPLFSECLQIDQDLTLRIHFLQLLDELFEKQELESSWAPLAQDVLSKLLIPCAVGPASKTEAAVQCSAMVAIGTFLRRDLCSQELMQELIKKPEGLLFVLKTCIDEDSYHDVRRASIHMMHQFLRIAGPILSDEERLELIRVLSKRMKDSSKLIRRAILPVVEMFFTSNTTMPSNFSDSEVRSVLQDLVNQMDEDEHPHTQEDWCRAMEPFVVQKPEIVMDVLGLVHGHQGSPGNLGTPLDIDLILNAVHQRGQHKRDILTWPNQTFTINEVPMYSMKA